MFSPNKDPNRQLCIKLQKINQTSKELVINSQRKLDATLSDSLTQK